MMSPMPSKTLAYVSWLCFPYLLFYVTLLKNRVKVKCANMWALKIRLFCQAICLEQIVAIQKIKPVFPSRPLPIPPFETHLWMKKWTNACSKKMILKSFDFWCANLWMLSKTFIHLHSLYLKWFFMCSIMAYYYKHTMQQPNLINFWVRKILCACALIKTRMLALILYIRILKYRRESFFSRASSLWTSDLFMETDEIVYNKRIIFNSALFLCLYFTWCTWWLKGGKTWSFLGKVLKNSTLASGTMPAWMRAKKSVPEKHAGNELNEEKHMCFAI